MNKYIAGWLVSEIALSLHRGACICGCSMNQCVYFATALRKSWGNPIVASMGFPLELQNAPNINPCQ